MRLFRPCFLAVWFFPEAFFREKTAEKVLYLTFDDGPDRLSTPLLLNILGKHQIRAVFFCSGKSASVNPDLIRKIKSEGHIVGNHGYDHLNGLFTSKLKYLNDVRKASESNSDTLFRPPYGIMSLPQYRELKKSYHIILWDIMPFDFDRKFGSRNSLSILKKLLRPGSVIVLHDTGKSTSPEFLKDFILYAAGEGYGFKLP
jgi:peptidoglycan/xylan/chitin deacetylase (PgdA/CDA1 family)